MPKLVGNNKLLKDGQSLVGGGVEGLFLIIVLKKLFLLKICSVLGRNFYQERGLNLMFKYSHAT